MTDGTHTVPNHPAFRDKHPGHLVLEKVIVSLAILTLIELTVSFLLENNHISFEIGASSLVILAFIKAVLIAGYFMHLFYEKKPFIIAFVAFIAPLLIALPIALVILTL